MEQETTILEKDFKYNNSVLIGLFTYHKEIDSRIDFLKCNLNIDDLPEEIQEMILGRFISFQNGSFITVVNGPNEEINVFSIETSDENKDLCKASIDPSDLWDEEYEDIDNITMN